MLEMTGTNDLFTCLYYKHSINLFPIISQTLTNRVFLSQKIWDMYYPTRLKYPQYYSLYPKNYYDNSYVCA